jgi:hypothetical protein
LEQMKAKQNYYKVQVCYMSFILHNWPSAKHVHMCTSYNFALIRRHIHLHLLCFRASITYHYLCLFSEMNMRFHPLWISWLSNK